MEGNGLKYKLTFILALALNLLVIAGIARAETKTSFDDAFQSVKNDKTFQFDLESASELPELGWLENFFAAIVNFIASISSILEAIFLIGVGCVLAFILYAIAKAIYETRLSSKLTEPIKEIQEELYTPDQKRAQILLDEVDALADAGRYDEAVHQLLYRSIQDIDNTRPNVIRKSFTSREIATLSFLSPETRQAFTAISLVVEACFFGAKSIGRAEFEACRAAYSQFAAGPEAAGA